MYQRLPHVLLSTPACLEIYLENAITSECKKDAETIQGKHLTLR